MESNSINTPSNSGNHAAADGMLNKAATGAHAAVDKVASAADDAARKAKPTIDRVAGYAHQAVDKAAGAAGPAADWLNEQGQDLKATQEKLLGATGDYVKAHPWKAVGIAVAAGFLISRIVR